MENKKPERDAGDVAPRPPDKSDEKKRDDTASRQASADQDERTDGGRAIPADDLSSANDE